MISPCAFAIVFVLGLPRCSRAVDQFVTPTYTSPEISDITCKTYSCVNLPGDECMRYSYQGVLLDSCDELSYCPENNEGVSHCVHSPQAEPQKWPGEKCSTDQKCLYGECVESKCYGNSTSESCSSHEDCHVGHRCSNNVCKNLIKEGNYGCATDYDCVNSSGCNEGMCVTYFTLAEGDPVEHCVDSVSLLCESTICYRNFCLAKVKNDRPAPALCTSSADCKSSHYEAEKWSLPLYKECACDYTGQGYCQLFPGDKPFENYIEKMYYWVNGKRIHRCHTLRRFSEDCMKDVRSKRYSKGHLKAYYKVHHYPKIQQISDCAKEMFEPKAVVSQATLLLLAIITLLA